MERMKAQQDEMLKRQLQLDEAQRLAASKIRKQELEEKREAQRPSLVGYLKARPDYQLGGSMAMPIPALEDTESLEEQVAYEKTRDQQEQEAVNRARQAKQDSLKMQLVTPSGSVVYGTYDELASKYPELIENINVAKTKESKPLDASFTESDGEIRFSFGPGVTPEQAAEYKKNVYKSLGVDAGGGGGIVTPTQKTLPKGPPPKPGETPVVRRTGETRSGAAAAIAEEQATSETPATAANMYGPLSPSEQFVQTGRRLGALEGRGGASTYGAQQTLTGPFYEAVASELGVQPKRLGQESAIVRSAKAVVASEFPTEAWNKLPQEIKNRIYIEALNRSAAQMAAPPKPSMFSSGYAESPFAPYSYSR